MNDRIKKAQYISKKIKKLRKISNMSQYALAEHSGVTASAISQIENGNRIPSLIVSRKIAEALHISVQELTGDDIPSTTKTNHKTQAFFRKYQSIEKLDKIDKKTILNLINSLSKRKQKK